jgi:uncharacterized repeat protein (TIGR01451 family)
MKKIIGLIIPIGLVVILFFVISSYARASYASSSNTIRIGDVTKPAQAGPPWWDPAWQYRRPVVISNTGLTTISRYQVLIKLDNNNFKFSHANAEGSDIRFTNSDGTMDLYYWIESWDSVNLRAYVWVRVIGLASGNTNIFLYYGNPTATTTSDGSATFESFDDNWSQFTGKLLIPDMETLNLQSINEVNFPFVWSAIGGSPGASAGVLSLEDGDGIMSNSTYLYKAMGFKAKYGLGSTDERVGFIDELTGQGTMIGDNKPGNANDLFLIDSANGVDFNYVTLPKVGGEDWHIKNHVYELLWKSGQMAGDIDHGVSTATGGSQQNDDLPVILDNGTDSIATLEVDWVYLRQYPVPEPTYVLGAEQGLVDLGINIVDAPDPLNTTKELTYLLTISNTSSIAAPGVVVTDTLPGSVQLVTGKTSPSCIPAADNDIVCSLNTIVANATANVTIVVKPTADGMITNTAIVASPGFELDLSNNMDEVITLVDSIPPNVNWEKPVHNGQDFNTFGGWIELEASATDNDQVSQVEFLLFDHLDPDPAKRWKSKGIDYVYPFQVQFNSYTLVPNIRYQMFVRATDRAGNVTNPLDPLRAIYVQRTSWFFDYLPITTR